MWSLDQITAPPTTAQALSVEEARAHSHLPELAGDDLLDLGLKIDAAVADCETYTQRQLLTATWELRLSNWLEWGIAQRLYPGFPVYPLVPFSEMPGILFGASAAIRLPKPPVTALVSVKYLDGDGIEQTVAPADYVAEGVSATPAPHAQRALLLPAYGKSWPTALVRPGAIKIRFTSGYGNNNTAVPAAIRAGLCLRVAELYERREEATVGRETVSANAISARRLWYPFRAF